MAYIKLHTTNPIVWSKFSVVFKFRFLAQIGRILV